jgi:hypothetical protein
MRLVFIAIFAALSLAGCDSGTDLRYRLTVEVDTPEGLRTGSSVVEVEVRKAHWWALAGRPVNFDMRGEAVAVDLPQGRTLFALLSRPGFPDAGIRLPLDVFDVPMAQADFEQHGEESDIVDRVGRLMRDQPSATLEGDSRPFLVRFENAGDPESVQEVNPRNLAGAFGPGYSLRRVTITITSDQVTTGIRNRLPWLGEHPEPSLGTQGLGDNSLSAFLHHGAFIKGL